MRLIIIMLCCSLTSGAQDLTADYLDPIPVQMSEVAAKSGSNVKLAPVKWKMTGNRLLTGSLVFVAGASKGFNETLTFHWKSFRQRFPNINAKWFNPAISWRNKYKNGDPEAGAKFPLSTSVLVGVTDQYHLNTMINRMAWTSAVILKIGDGKKPLKHYVMDLLYYSFCHQAGFAMTYYPFKKYR